MDVIDRINLRLAEIGKTGADMSRALNLSNSIYSQWNTRKTKPSKKTIAKVASYLDVSVEYLLTGEGQEEKPPTNTGEELSAPDGYDRLTPANRMIVDRLIADLAKSQSVE